jgi:hypothetical protein
MPAEAERFSKKRRPLLGYGTVNSDATMEHETQRQRGNGYASNNRGIVGNSVLCGSVHISRESKHS